jgi:PAS domain S-box-containing protein
LNPLSRPNLEFLQGGGAMGERMRAFDWANHPMGPPEHWPGALRMTLSLCLNSSLPTAIYWGPDLHVLYNDAWSVIPAEKHPGILGLPAREGWSDIWEIVGPQFEQVMQTGQGLALYEQMLPMVRGGRPAETWWNYSFTPIRQADHSIAGVFNQGHEVTGLVFARREREAELRRWREYFRQAPAAVALLRGPQHVFAFANDSYLRLVGGRDVEGKSVLDALPEVVDQGFIQLLDSVYSSGRPYVGSGVQVKLRRGAGDGGEGRIVDFVYEPIRDGEGRVDGVFVLATDVTDRARAENALRIANWQLGEERARLASLIEAEKRAQQALRRFNETLEGHVRQRTAQLTQALDKEAAAALRLRATFETDLLFQGYMDAEGVLLDANPTSLAAIGCTLADVVGRNFSDTPWFAATPGLPEIIRDGIQEARAGRSVRAEVDVNLPGGAHRFLFSLRPVFDKRKRVIGMVPEAVELPKPAQAGAA